MSNDYVRMRSKFIGLALLALLALSSCTKPNPASCADDFCDDPALPFCDVDGSIGGVPDTCIAIQCTPGEFEGCRDDNALTCNDTGTNIDETACEFGCGETGCLPCNTPECQPVEKHIIPKYVPTACDDLANTQLVVSEDTTIDTSNDANCTDIIAQPTGPEICVIHHESISVAANHTLRVEGLRAIAFVADRQFEVDGVVDASAETTTNGPGGGTKVSGSGSSSVAGGGAGNRTRGGHGATTNTTGGAANGGAAEPNPTTLSELFGGPQAGVSGSGGGGGAATLICCRCELNVAGIVDVNGGGGLPANTRSGPVHNSRGGGAGGNIVLQGMGVVVEGQLFANGGGGGSAAGIDTGGIFGKPGKEGLRSAACAAGGATTAGAGGAGGCATADAAEGVAPPSGSGTGAGGGSAGFVLTYTPSGVAPALTPFAISPAFEPNGTIPTN